MSWTNFGTDTLEKIIHNELISLLSIITRMKLFKT